MSLSVFFILLLVGSISGIVAGILGIGGGILIVPVIVYLLQHQSTQLLHLQHIAVGTSFAIMIFTGISNARAQHRHHNIDWSMFRKIIGGIVLGTLIGSLFAAQLSEKVLRIFFIIFLYAMAIKMWMQPPMPDAHQTSQKLIFSVGTGIGLLSSWLGIGGGMMTVPFLNYCGVNLHKSIGTSALVTLPLAIAGTLSYLIAGWNVQGLPEYTIGFIYLPGLLILACCTMIFAPVGVRIAKHLSENTKRYAFIVLVMILALDMTRKFLWQ